MDCEQCGEREAAIKKRTRSGVQAQCGICRLNHEVLMITRSPAGIIDCHRLRVVSRLLGLKIRGEDLTEHIQDFDTEYVR